MSTVFDDRLVVYSVPDGGFPCKEVEAGTVKMLQPEQVHSQSCNCDNYCPCESYTPCDCVAE